MGTIADFILGRNTGTSTGIIYSGTPGKYTKSGEFVTPENSLRDATVLSCVNVISQGIAQLPIRLESIEGTEEVSRTDAVNALLRRPNSYQTSYDFKYSVVSTLLTYGNCYIRLIRAGGRATELIILDPMEMTITPSITGAPLFKHNKFGTVEAEDMIHIRDIVTFDVTGKSRVELAAERIGALMAADRRIADTFRNGINVQYALTSVETLDSGPAQEFVEAVAKAFGAGGTQTGGVAFLQNGDIKELKGSTPADMDLRELKLMLINEVAAVFRVPAFLVGGSGDEKYSNVAQKQSAFYRDTLNPIILSIQEAMTMKLVTTNDLEVRFDVSDLLKGDVEKTATVAQNMYTAGVWTRNEARTYSGKEEVTGEDGFVETPTASDDTGTTDQPNATEGAQ